MTTEKEDLQEDGLNAEAPAQTEEQREEDLLPEGEEKPELKIREMSNEELTIAFAQLNKLYNDLAERHSYLVEAHNRLSEYVNNLQENPAFVGGLLGAVNDLYNGGQVFFVQLHQTLEEEDQKKCYRGLMKSMEEAGEDCELQDRLIVERFVDDEWQAILRDDPVLSVIIKAIFDRMVMANVECDKHYFFTITVVDGPEDDTDGQQDTTH